MYFPYFRGKLYELITIRESVDLIADNDIIPIIEPVRKNINSLQKTLELLKTKDIHFILVINPSVGELKNVSTILEKYIIKDVLEDYKNFSIGYILNANSNLIDIEDFLIRYCDYNIAIIHYGFPNGKELKSIVDKNNNIKKHIFIDNYSGKLYQRYFRNEHWDRILIRNGFKRRKNADYPEDEHFSDLHVTYEDEGMDGYGDFLIVGDDYSETGGPAYAIAIHLTYIDDERDMCIKHFISERTETPVDPAGKFFEALEKLIVEIDDEYTLILKSNACEEYRILYKDGHFPGLGYVKKISMKHHIELIAGFIKKS